MALHRSSDPHDVGIPKSVDRVLAIWPEWLATGLLAGMLSTDPLVPVIAGRQVGAIDWSDGIADWNVWVGGGQALLHGDLAGAYGNPDAQVGPVVLAADALVDQLSGPVEARWWLLRLAVMWAYLLFVALLCRPSGARPAQRVVAVACAGAVAAIGYASDFYTFGRWWYLPTALLMLGGALCVHRGRFVLAGILIGATLWLEPSAALALALFALAPRWSVVWRGVGIAVVVGIVPYLPFVPTRGFALGSGTWGVKEASWAWIVRLVAPGTVITPTWSTRVLQAVLAGLIAIGVIYLLRTALPMPMTAIAAAGVPGMARLVTESYWWTYHWFLPFAFLLAAFVRLAWLERREAIPLGIAAWLGAIVAPLSPPLASLIALALLASTPARLWQQMPVRRGFRVPDGAG